MFACCLLLMVGLVHSSPVHKNNSTSTRLRLRQETSVNRYDGDSPTVAWTLLRVLDSMARTLEGPGAFFPRREFRTIMGSMFRLDRGLMDSQVGVGWGSRNVTCMRQSPSGEGLEGGYRLLQSWRGSRRRLGKPPQLVSPASLYMFSFCFSGSWSAMQLSSPFLMERACWPTNPATM